jgi:hypothetical protein
MPVYEYKGVHYDLADTDPAAAKAKIQSHLGEKETQAPKQTRVVPRFGRVETQSPTGKQLLEAFTPVAETAGMVAGGTLGGASAGPLGAVGGAGLGYTTGREAMQTLGQLTGVYKPSTPTDIAQRIPSEMKTGAMYEMGGQTVGAVAPKVLGGMSEFFGRFGGGPKRAAKIAAKALGDNLPRAREILKQATGDISASQALAKMDAPTAQALLKRAESRDPEFFSNLFGKQNKARLDELTRIARGSNQTEARMAREELEKLYKEELIPVLNQELERANIAGREVPRLTKEAGKLGAQASGKVQDVRRFAAAKERAAGRAQDTYTVTGQPRVPGRYTYMSELEQKADQVMDDAAWDSLVSGAARRDRETALATLDAHGLKPLEGNSLVARLTNKLRDPSFAGNDLIKNSLTRVIRDIRNYANADGVIDARAIDAIRKHSVNSVIQKMYPAANQSQVAKFTASVMESVKPALIDAIEEAGGTGYRQYLTNYAKGMQAIGQSEMGAELMELYQTNPKTFVALVEGNRPDIVEKTFGPGSYNIVKEMSDSYLNSLRKVSGELTRDEEAARQAGMGSERLADVLRTELKPFRLPSFFSSKVTVANTILDQLEGKVSRKTMDALTKASRSAKDFQELLDLVPPDAKQEAETVLQTSLRESGKFKPFTERKRKQQ